MEMPIVSLDYGKPEIIYDVREFVGGLYTWHLQYTYKTTIFNIGHGTKHELLRELKAFDEMMKNYA